MKERIKSLLQKLRLFATVQIYFHNLKTIPYVNIRREWAIRRSGAPDHLPLPPAQLVFNVIGHSWRSIFFQSGKTITDYIQQNLKDCGYGIRDFAAVLDFGCGCGRLIRHFLPHGIPYLAGTDYNAGLITWCQTHLKKACFFTNRLAPPLSFPDERFDFIYAQSIFTHLSRNLQIQWLQEFHRLLKHDGILYLTTHGEQFKHYLSPDEWTSVLNGELIVHNEESQGRNVCSTFQLPRFFNQLIHNGFQAVAFTPGRSAVHLRQDVNIWKKNHRKLVLK